MSLGRESTRPMAMITAYGLDIPEQALSLDGFREWLVSLGDSAPRMCFCAGRLHIDRSPQDYRTHGPVVDAINDVLVSLTKQHDLGRYVRAPNWFTDEDAELSTEPDGFLVRWASIESGRVRINPERTSELLGAPDMVLEVVSRNSRRKDTVEMVEQYAAAGIAEYWIADALTDEPRLQILTLGSSRQYVHVPADAEGWIESPLWRARFRLLREPARAGWVDYRLEHVLPSR
jgi:Uma2 family endonuclease